MTSLLDQIWFPVFLTLWIASISSFPVLCTGVVIAYIFARRDFPGKELAEILVTLPLVLPPTVIGYLLVILLGKNGFIVNKGSRKRITLKLAAHEFYFKICDRRKS